MQTMVERGCGLDVHQARVVACLLIVLKNGKVQKQIRTFGTTTRELVSLREWLLSEGCTHVATESTGDGLGRLPFERPDRCPVWISLGV
jgi:transposase